ncbi:transcriptional control [Fimbriiglobus ruber]|uniref:Transcriptional control n=1 Tax=Fimbriiglobus ruber TaxID=1908690 RepID=A0A225DU43_9BACT|nr:transcriptional control [Fimbriiglobus ruber]
MDTDIGADPAASPTAPAARPPDKSVLFLPLFLRNERPLYAYIYTLLPRRADADDVLQETSLVLWDKFDVACPPTDFLAWARKVAYHKVLDFHKKTRRSQARLSQLFLDKVAAAAAEPTLAAQLEARREALNACVEKLTPQSRELLTHRFAEGATTQSTSEQVGRSVDAVYKALAKLRQSLFECAQTLLAREGCP